MVALLACLMAADIQNGWAKVKIGLHDEKQMFFIYFYISLDRLPDFIIIKQQSINYFSIIMILTSASPATVRGNVEKIG